MLRATLRTAFAHKGRLFLTTLSVVLGVAFITGTLMLTAALDRTFVDIIEGSAQDVQVTKKSAVEVDITTDQGDGAPLLVDDADVATVQGVDGVAAAEGSITRNGVYLLDSDGQVVGAVGPPALGVNWPQSDEVSVATISEGRAPEADDEIAVDDVTFPKVGAEIGDEVDVITPDGQVTVTMVGTYRFGETGGLAGATLTAFTSQRAQELLAEPGKWTAIDVAVADGSSDDEVADAIRTALDNESLVVKTRAEQVEEQSDDLRAGLAFFNYALIGFAVISLFVATFLIYNTFAMLVAQRGRELALLRAIGASRGQVLRSVLTEAVIVALVAVVFGIAMGYLLALGLGAVFSLLGLELTAGIAITPAAVIWAAVVGLLVTLVAALLPAIRGSRVPPIEALRDAQGSRDGVGRVRTIIGALFLLFAVAAIWSGLGQDDGGQRALWVALGCLLLLVSAILLAPLLGVGLIRLAAPLMGLLGGTTGTLAARNALRAPGRLATTASALTIGLALVVSVTVVTISAKDSINALIDSSFKAELVVATQTGQPFSTSVADEVRDLPGVEFVFSEAGGPVKINGESGSVTAIGGGPLEAAYALDTDAGDLADLADSTAVVDATYAEENGLSVGDTFSVQFPNGEEEDFTLGGIYADSDLLEGVVVGLDDYRAGGGAAQDTQLYVVLDDEADPAVVLPEVEDVAAANPLLVVLDQTEIKEQNAQQINILLYLVYALLGLSVIIAALGVVNTLTLSVVERVRELGLLRAVGATRRQVRRIVRWEAVAVSILGAVLGIVVGLAAGIALQRALADAGVAVLSIPVWPLVGIVVLSLLIGVLASVLPAIRASRLQILDSIAAE